MRIIKHGTKPEPRRVRFTCSRCGCVYDCRLGEYVVRAQYNEFYAASICPECGANNVTDFEIKGREG